MDNRSEVRQFLVTRRAKITPEQAGLPFYGGNRRVPGLRREEVAMMAGVSADYYTRLEKGNLTGVSDSVLHAVARALRLDEAEQEHLFNLAKTANTAPSRVPRRQAPRVRPSVLRVLHSMTTTAAFVRNGRLDILAVNQLGRALYAPVFEDPGRSANLAARGDDNGRVYPSARGRSARRLPGLERDRRRTPDEGDLMSIDASGDGRLLGRLRSADGKGVVRMEGRFGTGIDDVWSALTDPRRLARWLGEVEGDLRLGGTFRAHFYASGWEGTGRIEACEPPRRLLVWRRDAEDPDGGPIEVTLTADGDQTILVWEERGMPLDFVAGYGAGIQIHVEDLKDHLAGQERRDPKARFGELFPSYQELAAALARQVERWFGPMADEPGFRAVLDKHIRWATALAAAEGTGLLFSASPPAYHLRWLVVSEHACGQGIGRALVAEAMRRFVS